LNENEISVSAKFSAEDNHKSPSKVKFGETEVKPFPNADYAAEKREWTNEFKDKVLENRIEQFQEWNTGRIDNSDSAKFCAVNSFSGEERNAADIQQANEE
jgi:hypothetical protein